MVESGGRGRNEGARTRQSDGRTKKKKREGEEQGKANQDEWQRKG